MLRSSFTLTVLLLSASSLLAQRVTLSGSEIVIEGVTLRGSVVWMQLAHEPDTWMTRFVTRDGTAVDEDGDGRIVIRIDQPVPLRSTFIAVDLDRGSHVVATPEGFTSVPIQPDDRIGRARGLRDSLDLLEIERNEMEVLLVRPRVGAWRIRAFEGSPNDSDKMNDGVLTVRFGDLRTLGTHDSAVPGVLQPGDIVFAVDPEDLSHFFVKVGN